MTDSVQTSAQDPAAALVDSRGTPARRAKDERCPGCAEGPEKRVKSGMGNPHPVCSTCGYEWHDEVFRG